MVEIWQLVNEISSFPEVLYKRDDLKNLSKFTDKHKKQSSGGVLTKDVLEKFAKFTDRHLSPGLFLNNVAGWKPETFRSSNFQKQEMFCSKKMFLKRLIGVSETALHSSSTK